MVTRPSYFQRYILPGFAFKAVVIGGGYATGRELVEFFFPSGPVGGILGLLLVMVVWSLLCALTFVFAYTTRSLDYRSFFKNLLGPAWIAWEVAYLLFLILVLAVFGAAAGEIGNSLFGLPVIFGTLILIGLIVGFATFGSGAVEALFKYASIFEYAVYALFVILAFSNFGDRITHTLSTAPPAANWVGNGLTYASYNLVGAVVILPVIRHLTSGKDAVVAGLLAGPMAALPAILFFICIIAFYPEIGREALPSDYILAQLDIPAFHLAFQLMIFCALLDTGTGLIHAVNERVVGAVRPGGRLSPQLLRGLIAISLLLLSIFLATKFGFVALIEKGYSASAYVFLVVFVVPLLTIGVWRLVRARPGLQHPT